MKLLSFLFVFFTLSSVYTSNALAAGSGTCTPAGSGLCTAFETGCGFVGGGMSTAENGGVTCSVAQAQAVIMNKGLRYLAPRTEGRTCPTGDDVPTCTSDGSRTGDEICLGFGMGCKALGCGPSTNEDGATECACG